MLAVLRLYDGRPNAIEIPIPVTMHGVPILPSVGDTIRYENLNYTVIGIFWNYSDDVLVVVKAHLS